MALREDRSIQEPHADARPSAEGRQEPDVRQESDLSREAEVLLSKGAAQSETSRPSPNARSSRVPAAPSSGPQPLPPDADARRTGSPEPSDLLPARTPLNEAAPSVAGIPAGPSAKPVSRKKPILLTILAILILFGGYQGYRYWTEGRFMVSTDDAYVAADISILAAKVPGYVASVEASNNQSVEAGQLIARIDDGDYRNAVQSARDKLATLEATVARIARQIQAAQAQVAQAQPQIESAMADRVRAVSEYERQTKLAQSDFASRARFEQALSDRDRANAAVRSAQAALLVARANVDVLEAQRVEAIRTGEEARTQLAKAERDLSFTEIRAPVGGVIGNRAAEIGNYVQTGTRIAALVPLASVRVDANFKETQLVRVRPGQAVHLEVDAYPGRQFPATVESIAPASGSQFSLLPPENATGNFTKIVQRVPVRIRIDPEIARQGLLRPGMSAVVRVDSRDGAAPTDKP